MSVSAVPSRQRPEDPGDLQESEIGGAAGLVPSPLASPPARMVRPAVDAWVVLPNNQDRRKRGRGSDRRAGTMAQPLVDLVEQFCTFQRKQRARAEGGVKTYRWILRQFLTFVRVREGRLARPGDLSVSMIQGWIDDIAGDDLGPNTLRCRIATLSSLCTWLVKRGVLAANPVDQIDRPPRRHEPPAVPGPAIMDALIEAAKQRGRPRDLAIFLILRFTGMRRESVARLRVLNLDPAWGLRGVRLKGERSQDIPLPSAVVQFLAAYVERVLRPECVTVRADTPLFWSAWGRRGGGKSRQPMAGKNIWRLCKTYGRLIGYPDLKPHDLRHGVAVEVLEQRHDLEEVRALLGHARLDTTQLYTKIRPPQLKRAVAFYDSAATRMLTSST
jgi:integrase/recombinase XerC